MVANHGTKNIYMYMKKKNLMKQKEGEKNADTLNIRGAIKKKKIKPTAAAVAG